MLGVVDRDEPARKNVLDNMSRIGNNVSDMTTFTTREVAKKLGITAGTLSRYISAKKIPAPKLVQVGHFRVHSWTEADVEHVRQLLPKIANGRKTRYKKQSAVSKKQSAKAKPRKPKKK